MNQSNERYYKYPATDHQLAFLARNGLISEYDEEPDYHTAKDMINDYVAARRKLAPTPLQEKILRAKGLWRETMTRGEACDLIGQSYL
jgi:hypothetical protein